MLHGPSQTQEGAPGKPSQNRVVQRTNITSGQAGQGVIMSSSMPLKGVRGQDQASESQMVWAWAGAMMIGSSKASSRFAGAPQDVWWVWIEGLIRWVLVGFSELSSKMDDPSRMEAH